MDSPSDVPNDIAQVRAQLRATDATYRALLRLTLWRPLVDLGIDFGAILLSTAAVVGLGAWCVPMALVVIANRQRALGNILHDAGHRNLSRMAGVNDALARWSVAPLMFASLAHYRATHFRHHMALGDAQSDPDLLAMPAPLPRHWGPSVAAQLVRADIWWGSLLGHLGVRHLGAAERAWILVWWAGLLGGLGAVAGTRFTVTFVLLWLLARATLFHAITTVREMCDHAGLRPGGVLGFTRDMACRGPWRWLIHPRNNGYHLTHHLLPAVPYYRLPEAHRALRRLPIYQARGRVCTGYVFGARAVVHDWQRRSAP